MKTLLFTLACVCVVAQGELHAGPVMTLTATPYYGPGTLGSDAIGELAAVSWTVTSTWSDVSIQGVFGAWGGSFVDAVLSHSLGASADLIAQNTVPAIGNAIGQNPPVWTTLFTGLTLTPGSYNLVIGGSNTGFFFLLDGASNVQTGAGVTYDGAHIASSLGCDPLDLPSCGVQISSSNLAQTTGWISWPNAPLLSIDTSTSAAVPEPGGSICVLGALALLAVFRRRAKPNRSRDVQ